MATESNLVVVFRVDQTELRTHDGKPAAPTLWYYAPADYEGDSLWSQGYPTEDAARRAGEDAIANGEIEA